MKTIVILTVCHVSEFQKILDSSYTRIGLSIYVKFSLGKRLGTSPKLFKIVHRRHKIPPSATECVTKSICNVSAYFFSSKRQHYRAINNVHIITYFGLKYPESCKLIVFLHFLFLRRFRQRSYPTF